MTKKLLNAKIVGKWGRRLTTEGVAEQSNGK